MLICSTQKCKNNILREWVLFMLRVGQREKENKHCAEILLKKSIDNTRYIPFYNFRQTVSVSIIATF